jgi:flagellar biogenesis protein FliO
MLIALALMLEPGAGMRPGSIAFAETAAPSRVSVPPATAIGSQARRPVARSHDGGFSARGESIAGRPDKAGGWWLGTAGIALALAILGWVSVASKRFLPSTAAGSIALRVVGRTTLSPKHTIYLLEVGRRVLIVGTGAQGSPTLLGELADPADRAVLSTQPDEQAAGEAAFQLDDRLGGDA